MPGAHQEATDVGNHEPHEPDGSAHRDHPTHHEGGAEEEKVPGTDHVHPSACGHLLAGGKDVKLPGQPQGDEQTAQDQRDHFKDRSVTDHLDTSHKPADDAEGVGEIGNVLGEQVQAGKEETHRNPGQQHGSCVHAPPRPGYPIDQKYGHRCPREGPQRGA